MISILIIGAASFAAAGLTLFTGFGLGILLLPVFALFFPIEIAVAVTAFVHLVNNIAKLFLLGRHADRAVVLRFGLPAVAAAFAGAWLLGWLTNLAPLASYELGGRTMHVTPVKLVIAGLLLFFAWWEWSPRESLVFEKKYLPMGGLLSGFFGGLSGHQGAFRTVFLLKCGLSKEGFLGTGALIACMVDVARLSVYGTTLPLAAAAGSPALLIAAIGSALLGTWTATRYIKKVTMRAIQAVVSIMLLLIALGLAMGAI